MKNVAKDCFDKERVWQEDTAMNLLSYLIWATSLCLHLPVTIYSMLGIIQVSQYIVVEGQPFPVWK